jgi:hypothetical protein
MNGLGYEVIREAVLNKLDDIRSCIKDEGYKGVYIYLEHSPAGDGYGEE